jgi:hypothetical protein
MLLVLVGGVGALGAGEIGGGIVLTYHFTKVYVGISSTLDSFHFGHDVLDTKMKNS